jgi:hypothetical protein
MADFLLNYISYPPPSLPTQLHNPQNDTHHSGIVQKRLTKIKNPTNKKEKQVKTIGKLLDP